MKTNWKNLNKDITLVCISAITVNALNILFEGKLLGVIAGISGILFVIVLLWLSNYSRE